MTALSRATGACCCTSQAPGAGTLRAGAQQRGAWSDRRASHAERAVPPPRAPAQRGRVATRTVATRATRPRAAAAWRRCCSSSPRATARSPRGAAGCRPRVTVTFTAPGHPTLRQSIPVTFLRTARSRAKARISAHEPARRATAAEKAAAMSRARPPDVRSRCSPCARVAAAGARRSALAAAPRPPRRRRAPTGDWNSRAAARRRRACRSPRRRSASGRIGDIEFWAPNRGLLITAGNGSTIPPGRVGLQRRSAGTSSRRLRRHRRAHRLGGPGRILDRLRRAPRAGRESAENGNRRRWKTTRSATSPAARSSAPTRTPAFQADSYQAMHAAGCFDPDDCWFAGDPLPEPQLGAFQLHWNGSSLDSRTVPAKGMRSRTCACSTGASTRACASAAADQRRTPPELPEPAASCTAIKPNRHPAPTFERGRPECPLYGAEELPEALDSLHLGADAKRCGARPAREPDRRKARPGPGDGGALPKGSGASCSARTPGSDFTNLPKRQLPGAKKLAFDRRRRRRQLDRRRTRQRQRLAGARHRRATRAQPSPPRAAIVARLRRRHGLDEQTLPSTPKQTQGVGPKGAAAKIACPGAERLLAGDHAGLALSPRARQANAQLARSADPAFAGLITYRPATKACRRSRPTRRPPDDSGLIEEPPHGYGGALAEATAARRSNPRSRLPLLSDLHTRLVHGTTLELRFHLAVKARVRLLAKRHKRRRREHRRRHAGGGQAQAAAAPEPPALADEARAADPRARAAADGHGQRSGRGPEHRRHRLDDVSRRGLTRAARRGSTLSRDRGALP